MLFLLNYFICYDSPAPAAFAGINGYRLYITAIHTDKNKSSCLHTNMDAAFFIVTVVGEDTGQAKAGDLSCRG